MSHEYTFDVKTFAHVRITAKNEAAARKRLQELVDGADANIGQDSDGDPIIVELSIDGESDLIEIDGDAV